MQPTSKWVMYVEKREYVLTGAEVEAVVKAGNARFVVLKKLVINPAFIQNIVEVDDGEENKLPEHARVSFVDVWGRPLKD